VGQPLDGVYIMRVLHVILMIAVSFLQCGCRTQSASTPATSLPVSYSPASPESLEHLSIRRITLDVSAAARIAALARTNSPWGSRWVTCEPADFMDDGPWTSRLYILTGADSSHCVEVEARDHANSGVSFEWLNDRALFVRCWWGRIVSTDFVLDTETAHPLYMEDANYFRLVYDQTEK
jgi:hypothetical protein